MLKFIRRLFILLVLFLIVFVIYRYINPDGASKFIERIKSIPNKISSMFVSDEKDNLEIEGETISISGDVNLSQDSGDNSDDLDWLQSLNQEIEDILWDDKSEVIVDENILTGTNWLTDKNENTWAIVVTWVVQNTWAIVPVVVDINAPTSTSTTNTITKKNNQLSDSDYQQMKDVFGNLVE